MAEPRRALPILEVVDQLKALGVSRGDVLLVHNSFRAVRPIERIAKNVLTLGEAEQGEDRI